MLIDHRRCMQYHWHERPVCHALRCILPLCYDLLLRRRGETHQAVRFWESNGKADHGTSKKRREREQWCVFVPPYLLYSNISISFSSPSLLKILINRMAIALLGGLLSMALFFVVNMMRKQSNVLLTSSIGGFFIFLTAPLSYAVGHHFLLQFLNASLLKKSNSKVAASSAAASTGKNTAWTGQTGGGTGVTATTQSDTTMSPESETRSLND